MKKLDFYITVYEFNSVYTEFLVLLYIYIYIYIYIQFETSELCKISSSIIRVNVAYLYYVNSANNGYDYVDDICAHLTHIPRFRYLHYVYVTLDIPAVFFYSW